MSVPISAERWKQLEPLIDAALDVEPERRRAFAEDACRGDPELGAELMRLLAVYDSGDPLFDRPAAERFPLLVDDGMARLPALLDGRYRIEREIGRGGMATVYLAHDLRHERSVAVKVLHPETAAALGAERFLAEIKMTAQLHHPHILPLHDSGNADGFLFYVMPYVEGGSLRRRLEREDRLLVEDALRIAREIASALDAAHRHGVVHRDIKPENILLHDGTALVADFGIAIAMSDAAPRLTQVGSTVGTPQYMSPEQAIGGGPVDSRSDVYALGMVVYEMLAGKPPFSRTTALDMLAKRVELPPPPLNVLQPATPGVVDVMTRVLARNPDERFRTASDFAEALGRSLAVSGSTENQGLTSAVRGRRARNVTLAALAGLAVVLVVGERLRARVNARPALDPKKVVVLPFAITGGDSSLTYLPEGLVDLISPMLNGEAGGPLGVDARTAISAWRRANARREATAGLAHDVARDVGAGKAVFGTAVYASGRLTLAATLVDVVRGDARPLTPVTGAIDSLPALLDDFLRYLLIRHADVPERTVAELTSQSLPALRAYLGGRAAYRQGRRTEAIADFSRALDIDSTFALAALDLATATGRLMRQTLCRNYNCSAGSPNAGIRDAGTATDEAAFDRGVTAAWAFKSKLMPRDQTYLLALRGEHYPLPSPARATYLALQKAADAAPDHAETQYFLGLLMLYQGPVMGYSGVLGRARASFENALQLDPSYLAPLAGLVDVAAYESDPARLRRLGEEYLARDSTGVTADVVRWRVAVGTNDRGMRRAINERFESLDVPTLKQIATASQMSGLALDDADRAVALILKRATGQRERAGALYWGHVLALNRGRPRQAMEMMRVRRELDTASFDFWQSTTTDAIYSDVAEAEVASNIREREQWLARDTLLPAAGAQNVPGQAALQDASRGSAFYQSLWDWAHGRTAAAASLASWLRRRGATLHADVAEMLIATDARPGGADSLRARVESAARQGCCAGPTQIDLALATAYERAGRDSAALDVVRRGRWRYPTFLLSAHLAREGHLALLVHDTAGAVRAYEHYLVLRSNPELELRANRDSIQTIVNRLKRGR